MSLQTKASCLEWVWLGIRMSAAAVMDPGKVWHDVGTFFFYQGSDDGGMASRMLAYLHTCMLPGWLAGWLAEPGARTHAGTHARSCRTGVYVTRRLI